MHVEDWRMYRENPPDRVAHVFRRCPHGLQPWDEVLVAYPDFYIVLDHYYDECSVTIVDLDPEEET
jgi:hypothetical protein